MKSGVKADKRRFCTFWCQACLGQSKDDILVLSWIKAKAKAKAGRRQDD